MKRSAQLPAVRARRVVRLLAAWAALLLAAFAQAQSPDRAAIGEYQVKAAFLYHFTKFVEWPAAAQGDVIVVGVLGEDPFGPALDFLFGDKTLQGKHFEVRRISSAAEARACHVLYISLSQGPQMHRVLDELAGSPVLTVGDSREFYLAGGMIYMFVDESKIHFDINLGMARRSGLTISSSLLRLAQKVEGR